MARDYINIGSTPSSETCIGVGQPGARAETLVYSRQLKREFPAGMFTMKAFSHDFGTYHEVVAWFNTDAIVADDPERQAAFDAEGGADEKWDATARCELWHTFGQAYFDKGGATPPTEAELAVHQAETARILKEAGIA